ncbi:class I SAM-dependent methyltransferase [Mucilaginibacter aquatilis]|uniref:Methyltransferase domain-containing protein n=1 Tax=Mucilaginibacter aquatilis TaxID=1517760 RepID=A0A6I4I9S5_9SPHI|nr:methyltransferase domain-containing protein [Mucilaginibacter aquatilis]MVN91881.1 methyltransferase domain-containing protein [Mucilaginibacter aquatilis]
MNDVLGRALHDYYHNNLASELWIHNLYGPKELMPIEAYFRDEDDMPDLEWVALNECKGTVLDVGAGAGSHALELQKRGYEVTAMDISPLAVEVIKARGIKDALTADIFTYDGKKYDTLLLLMNGIGLAGTMKILKDLLLHLKSLLNEGGQLLFDSSDVAYLYEGKLPDGGYHGEIKYQYEYKNQKGEWFTWLYIDEQSLIKIAAECGFNMEVLYEDEYGQYLSRLTTQTND